MDSRVDGVHGILVDFEFYMAVLWVGRGPIGLVAPLRFKTLDSQPPKSSTGSVSIFQKSRDDLLAWYLLCFRPGTPTQTILEFFGRNQKYARPKVVQFRGGMVSPREVHSLMFLCKFNNL